MSFAEFLKAIHSPSLQHVAEHWNSARGAKRMPAWSDINPKHIAAELPIVWAYKYDPVSDSFTGRLSGQRISEIFKKNLHGLPMQQIYPEKDYPRLFARSKRVIGEPAFHHEVGLVFRHVQRFGEGERITLPLADDGITGNGLLGATVYLSQDGAPAADTGETESWFPL